jgi:hypothetical protein
MQLRVGLFQADAAFRWTLYLDSGPHSCHVRMSFKMSLANYKWLFTYRAPSRIHQISDSVHVMNYFPKEKTVGASNYEEYRNPGPLGNRIPSPRLLARSLATVLGGLCWPPSPKASVIQKKNVQHNMIKLGKDAGDGEIPGRF